MKAHLTVFALTAILVASVGMAPAFGQNPIEISTDKRLYSAGETVQVTGSITQLLGGFDITMKVTSPNGSIVQVGQITVGPDRMFDTTIPTGGTIGKFAGTYTIEVQYGPGRTALTTFELGDAVMDTKPPVMVEEPVDEIEVTITETTVTIEGSSEPVMYDIVGGKLVSFMPDVDAKSLIIMIESTDDGMLTMTIPKSVAKAELDGMDDEFIVLVDGEQSDDFTETRSDSAREIVIPFLGWCRRDRDHWHLGSTRVWCNRGHDLGGGNSIHNCRICKIQAEYHAKILDIILFSIFAVFCVSSLAHPSAPVPAGENLNGFYMRFQVYINTEIVVLY